MGTYFVFQVLQTTWLNWAKSTVIWAT